MDSTTGSRLLRRARLIAWRARFVVAAVCCGLAATATVQALRPPLPTTLDVVVTARAVTAGTPLTPQDVTTVAVDAGLAPELLTDPAGAVGRSAALSLPAGTPLSAALVTGGGLASQAPDGTVVVAVRLVESTWLQPGDRVDLLSTDDGAAYLARRALVLPGLAGPAGDAGSDGDGGGGGGLLGGVADDGGEEVTLLAVRPKEAAGVSTASGWGATAAVLVP
jgi:pilus assembly protein CpaB